jgi:hypothetical protein
MAMSFAAGVILGFLNEWTSVVLALWIIVKILGKYRHKLNSKVHLYSIAATILPTTLYLFVYNRLEYRLLEQWFNMNKTAYGIGVLIGILLFMLWWLSGKGGRRKLRKRKKLVKGKLVTVYEP